MMRERAKWWAIAGCVSLALVAGCTAEQTEEGAVPDVDVDVDPGRWPEYKVNWADIDVGTAERTITVPVVRVEKETRQVTVPYIDINPPGARDRDERVLTMDVDVPHAGYQLQISEVRASGDDLWLIAELQETGTPAAQAMTRVSDQVVVNAPESLDVRKVIIGQRPATAEGQQVRFVDSMNTLEQTIPAGARVLYKRGA